MTVFEYALYKFAAGLMSPDELERAQALAKKVDGGDQAARLHLRELTMDVIAEFSSAKSRLPSGNKK